MCTTPFRVWEAGGHASKGVTEVAKWGSPRVLESELKAESRHIRTIIKVGIQTRYVYMYIYAYLTSSSSRREASGTPTSRGKLSPSSGLTPGKWRKCEPYSDNSFWVDNISTFSSVF